MKKLINRPEAVVEEMVEGLVAVYPGLARLPGRAVVVRADAAEVARPAGGADLRGRQRARAGARGVRRPGDAQRGGGRRRLHLAQRPTPCSPRSGPSPGRPGRS